MDKCCEPSFVDIFEQFSNIFADSRLVSTTPYEMKSDGKDVQLFIAVPGYLKAELSISVDKSKNHLIIKGEPSSTCAGTPRARFAKPFTLSFTYKPTAHDVAAISSTLDDGILEVNVPLFPKEKQESNILSIPIQ